MLIIWLFLFILNQGEFFEWPDVHSNAKKLTLLNMQIFFSRAATALPPLTWLRWGWFTVFLFLPGVIWATMTTTWPGGAPSPRPCEGVRWDLFVCVVSIAEQSSHEQILRSVHNVVCIINKYIIIYVFACMLFIYLLFWIVVELCIVVSCIYYY